MELNNKLREVDEQMSANPAYLSRVSIQVVALLCRLRRSCALLRLCPHLLRADKANVRETEPLKGQVGQECCQKPLVVHVVVLTTVLTWNTHP